MLHFCQSDDLIALHKTSRATGRLKVRIKISSYGLQKEFGAKEISLKKKIRIADTTVMQL